MMMRRRSFCTQSLRRQWPGDYSGEFPATEQDTKENQCSSVLVKHIEAPVHLILSGDSISISQRVIDILLVRDPFVCQSINDNHHNVIATTDALTKLLGLITGGFMRRKRWRKERRKEKKKEKQLKKKLERNLLMVKTMMTYIVPEAADFVKPGSSEANKMLYVMDGVRELDQWCNKLLKYGESVSTVKQDESPKGEIEIQEDEEEKPHCSVFIFLLLPHSLKSEV